MLVKGALTIVHGAFTNKTFDLKNVKAEIEMN